MPWIYPWKSIFLSIKMVTLMLMLAKANGTVWIDISGW